MRFAVGVGEVGGEIGGLVILRQAEDVDERRRCGGWIWGVWVLGLGLGRGEWGKRGKV